MRLIHYIILLYIPAIGLAQVDTSQWLDSVFVSETAIRKVVDGSISKVMDRSQIVNRLPQSAADWMNQSNAGYIKSYGFGGLATMSLRGMSAAQSLITWNGLPIESPMLGQLDVALMPLGLMDEVSVHLGGQSTQWGSGAVGGVLAMENESSFDQPLSLELGSTIGQFDRYSHHIRQSSGNQKWMTKSQVMYHHSVNNFPYLIDGRIEKEQTHADVQMVGGNHSLGYRIDGKQQLIGHYWWQKSRREIPPSIRQTTSESYQEDASDRALLHYRYVDQKSVWDAKIAHFRERLDYFDPQIALESLSTNHGTFIDLGWKGEIFEHLSLRLSGMLTHYEAHIEEYRGWVQQNRISAMGALSYSNTKLNATISIRQDHIDNELQPFLISMGGQYDCAEWLELRGKISRDFRYPTLNDLHWVPGGNPELLPEVGWSEELSGIFSHRWRALSTSMTVTAYNKLIDNWIYWAPASGATFWTPNNLARVWSRGLEVNPRLTIEDDDIKLQLEGTINLRKATNEVAFQVPKIDKGQSLFYVPEYQYQSQMRVSWKDWTFLYRHQWTSSVLGVNQKVEGFDTGMSRISWNSVIDHYEYGVVLSVHNLWNADYQVVEDRPMMGQYIEIGFLLKV